MSISVTHLSLRLSKQACCVFISEKARKPGLTFLSACDPLLIRLTQSINKMSPKTNKKPKEMNPDLNKHNIIIVEG